MSIKYVVGFAFSRNKEAIVLIEKNKPDWQKGKFNGIGGKVEEGESPIDAMYREFKEETGVLFNPDPHNKYLQWHHFATLKINDGSVELYCYRIYNNEIFMCGTIESERVEVMDVNVALTMKPIIPNLKVLIPMAMDEDFEFAEINAIVK